MSQVEVFSNSIISLWNKEMKTYDVYILYKLDSYIRP